MTRRWISFFTTKCPKCRFRYGSRAERKSYDRVLSFLLLYPFECRSCNIRFRALHLISHPDPSL